MASNTVTLTFAGDSTSLDRTFKRVGAEAESVSHKLKDTSAQAKYMKTTLNGAGDAAALFGGQLGQTALTAGYSLAAIKDLTKGLGGLSKTFGDTVGSASGAKFWLGSAAAAAVVFYGAAKLGTWAGNQLNDMLGRTPSLAQRSAAAIQHNTQMMLDYAAASHLAGNEAYRAVAAQSLVSFHNQNGTLNDKTGFLQGPVPLDAGGRLVNSTNGGDTWAAAQAQAKLKAPKAASAGRSIQSAADSIAAAAKAAAEKLKQARDSIAQAMGGIVQALAGKLSAADAGTAGSLEHQLNGSFALTGATRGSSLIEKLRKQAQDTKKLARDLKQLAKMGLDKGLLSQLVNGGLDSLPAAEELLRGGKADISTANILNSQIQGNAGKIAVAEANRNLSKKDLTVRLKIDPSGGSDELGKLLRKWIRVQGGNVQTALGS